MDGGFWDIKSWMEDFGNIKNVVKHVARLGQSFGLSKETLTIMADDVELFLMWRSSLQKPTMCVSDGIGKISSEFAELMARKCDIKGVSPSAFQIRYGGDSVFGKKHKEVVDTLDSVLTDSDEDSLSNASKGA
ncbi:hypothetical protein Bca52824_085786 [Brassica carinata]|uniref:RNA-dependent RNA polymerase n=1 Tax=Brassica carinata TaxID=52824 RepID=A0A8X7P8U7_BRACI|nr:hypothetical protein Bca52824_085786 [Brassica carinata]